MNAVIAELVGLGAVTRAADQADRRRNQIAITKTGQELLGPSRPTSSKTFSSKYLRPYLRENAP